MGFFNNNKNNQKQTTVLHLQGTHVYLEPLNVVINNDDICDLHKQIPFEKLERFLASYGPINPNDTKKCFINYLAADHRQAFLVCNNKTSKPIGIVCLENINRNTKTLEIRNFILSNSPISERETKYLLFKYIFDLLKFKQIKWHDNNKKQNTHYSQISIEEWHAISRGFEETLYSNQGNNHNKLTSKL